MRIVGGRLLDPSRTGYLVAHAVEGRTEPPTAAPLSALLLLGCAYCGLRWLGSPLLAHDVAQAAARGALPFLRGSAALSADQCLVLRAALPFFDAGAAPSAQAVERAAIVFFRSCSGDTGGGVGGADGRSAVAAIGAAAVTAAPASLPPISVLPSALLLLRRAGLPESALALCAELLALDEHDRAHEPAYTVYGVTQGVRKSGAAAAAAAAAAAVEAAAAATAGTAAGGKVEAPSRKRHRAVRVREAPLSSANELARLRRAAPDSEGGAGARVAALVSVAFRMHAGWERWVEERLQPGLLGDEAARTLRAGAGGGALPLDAAPALLAAAPAAALAGFAALLGGDVLPGGDVGAGRGARGYPAGEYRAADARPEGRRVALSDEALAQMLRGRAAAPPRDDESYVAGASAGAGAGAGSAVAAAAVEVELDVGRREDFPAPGGTASEAALAERRRQLWPRALLDEVATCSGEFEALGARLVGGDGISRIGGVGISVGICGGGGGGGGGTPAAPTVRAEPAAVAARCFAKCPRTRALTAMLARLVGASEEQVWLRCDALELLVQLYS